MVKAVADLKAKIGETEMVKKIKEDPPFMRPNGQEGKFEIHWKVVIEKIAPALILTLLCFIGGSLWALTIKAQNRDMLTAIKAVDAKVDNKFDALDKKVDARDARQQRAISSVGILIWNHLFPKQPCPLDAFDKSVFSSGSTKGEGVK